MHTRFHIIFCSIFLVLLFFYACNKEKETERNYPRVATGNVTNINAGGATFNGSFLQAGTEEIIDHGFLFGTNQLLTISLNERIPLGASSGKGSFSTIFDRAMVNGKSYYVGAYAQTKDYIFYAEPVIFASKGGLSPEISQIVPGQGTIDDTVTIKGKYFSSSHYNTVKFNDKSASIISASDTAIVVHAPASGGKEFADIFVTVAEQTAQKTSGFKYMKPVITGFYPREGVVGDTIKITGDYFHYGLEVRFDQTKATIRKIGYKSVEVIVPACQNPQAKISVTVDGLTSAAEQSFVYAKPEITGLSADKGVIGDTIIIQGKNFGYRKEDVSVYFGEQAAVVAKANNTFLEVITPTSDGKTTLPLSVRVDGQLASDFRMFTYMAPAIESFEPISGKAGTIVTIKGQYFSKTKRQNSVMIDQMKLRIIETGKNQVKVIVPDTTYSTTSPITISIDGKRAESATKFEVVSPWVRKKDFEIFTENASGFVIDGKAYIAGGARDYENYRNAVWQYNADSDSWVQKRSGQNVNGSYAGFELYGKYYHADHWSDWYAYEPLNDEWRRIQEIEKVYSSELPRAFAVNNIGYIIGHDNTGKNKYVLWKYDPISNVVTKENDIPGYADNPYTFVIGDKGYVCFDYSLLEYTPTGKTWHTKSSLPSDIKYPKVAVVNNKAYFFFPGDSYNKSTMVWEYNPVNNQCRPVSYFPGNNRSRIFLFVTENKAYIGGGSGGNGWVKDVWEFDPSKL